ncbi:unnamed protein product [Malus baccata var. baccata]
MVFEFSFAFQTLIMIYSVKEFLEDGVYIPTDVKVKQMKRAMPDCVTVRDKPSALKAEDWDWVVVVFVLSRFSIRENQNDSAFKVNEALMSEFDAENKGDNGDVQTTYTGEGKGDDSESLIE